MPSNVVHTKRDEEKWEKAKGLAADAGHKEDYAYIMGIYKRMNPSHDFGKDSSMDNHRIAAEITDMADKVAAVDFDKGVMGWNEISRRLLNLENEFRGDREAQAAFKRLWAGMDELKDHIAGYYGVSMKRFYT